MTTIFIRPVEGRRVRLPESTEVVTAEIAVEDSIYWQRRLADGDVTLVPQGTTTNSNAKKEG